ncbi:hypothetical protein [Methylobacterium brachiatum]
MAIVRAHLEALDQMHREGASWVDLAAALAAQGVMQGTGDAAQPITARRLTALMASVRRERERHAHAARTRLDRNDLGRSQRSEAPELETPLSVPPSPKAGATLRLTPELAPRDPVDTQAGFPSAEDIRRQALAEVQKLLKKDTP